MWPPITSFASGCFAAAATAYTVDAITMSPAVPSEEPKSIAKRRFVVCSLRASA